MYVSKMHVQTLRVQSGAKDKREARIYIYTYCIYVRHTYVRTYVFILYDVTYVCTYVHVTTYVFTYMCVQGQAPHLHDEVL